MRVKTLTTVELGQTPLSITTLQVTKKTDSDPLTSLFCMNQTTKHIKIKYKNKTESAIDL